MDSDMCRIYPGWMALKIMPHGRLQEWVAEEKGYFAAEGLEYSFVLTEDYGVHRPQRNEAGEITTGAFETFGAGRDGADVSCACHWATSAAASERAGQLVTTAYSVANCAIVVPPESPIRRPEELAGVPIGVGYHSGSHFATVQALDPVLSPEEIKLSFQGPPNERLDALLQRQVPAATTWGVPLYIAQALGFRTVVDATFMIGFLVTGLEATKSDVEKYLSALRRAQMDIDLHPERYVHYHLRTVPERYRDQVDVRAFGTGERIVFLPYTREVFAATQDWTEAHHLFSERPESLVGYDEAALALPGAAARTTFRSEKMILDPEGGPIERSRLLYERALFEGDTEALAEAERDLDGLEADLALARGRVIHGRFLEQRAADPQRAHEDPRELALFERAAELYRARGDVRGEGEALFWVGCCQQVVRRDNEAAVPVLWRSLELATEADDTPIMAEALRHLGIAEHAAGRLDTARLHLEESTRLRREIGAWPGVASNLVGLIYIAAGQDRRDDALKLAAEAGAIAEASGARGLLRQIEEARAQL